DEQRTAVGERVELLLSGREQHGRRCWIDHLERVRPEGDEEPGHAERGRALGDALQDVAMSEVNAVEGAEGDHRAGRELWKAEVITDHGAPPSAEARCPSARRAPPDHHSRPPT